MNGGITASTDGFKLKYEQFLHACDAAEAEGLWNTEEYGQMEGYYFNILMGVILHVINADGNVAARETALLNESFGFEYTQEEVIDLYYTVGENIEGNYLDNARIGLTLLEGMNPELKEDYLELLNLICGIAAASDEGVNEAELRALRELRERI